MNITKNYFPVKLNLIQLLYELDTEKNQDDLT